MSSKKSYVTIGIDADLIKQLDNLAAKERRSRAFFVEEALVKYFSNLAGEKKESHAIKAQAI